MEMTAVVSRMWGFQDWLYQYRFWYDQLYLIPLSFAIMMLSFATTATVVIVVWSMRLAKRNSDRIANAIDNSTVELTRLRHVLSRDLQEGRKNTSELKEQLEKNQSMLQDNKDVLKQNNTILETLTRFMKFGWWG